MDSGTARHGWHPAISDLPPTSLASTTVMLNVRADSLSSDRQVAAKGKPFIFSCPGFISIFQVVASAPGDV